MQKSGNVIWEIQVPNGTYSVHLVCGDPSATDQIDTVSIEGTVCTDPTPNSGNFDEYNVQVNVTDGKLTVNPAPGASNAKVCFIDITGQ
jgi:hypothetical protein